MQTEVEAVLFGEVTVDLDGVPVIAHKESSIPRSARSACLTKSEGQDSVSNVHITPGHRCLSLTPHQEKVMVRTPPTCRNVNLQLGKLEFNPSEKG